MDITLIRNATLIVEYAGKKILVDPMLAEKNTYPPFGPHVGFPDAPRQDQNNPIENLPTPLEEIVTDVDAVIVTHLHLDHWDEVAAQALPKEIKLFVQNEQDKKEIEKAGFQNIEVLQENTIFGDIKLTKTKGEHGRGPLVELAGEVCGVVFSHLNEKTLYLAGDTVWYDAVEEAIETHNPEIIVVNAGANQFLEGGPLVMDEDDVYEVYKAATNAKIISVHMEAVNHWMLSKKDLKSFSQEKEFSANLLIPNDGESYSF